MSSTVCSMPHSQSTPPSIRALDWTNESWPIFDRGRPALRTAVVALESCRCVGSGVSCGTGSRTEIGKSSHPVLRNRPAETQPAPMLATQTANARAETLPARVPPVRKQNRHKTSTKLAADPKLDVFPSPRPLSEEELALARYVRNFPSDAKQVAQAQQASAREVLAKMQALSHESTESN